MGDGGWDSHGKRIVINTNWFTYSESKRLQSIILTKFHITSYLVQVSRSQPDRGYVIKIPNKDVPKVREIVAPLIYPTLQYKLGL